MTTFMLPKSVFTHLAILLLSLLSYTAFAQNFIEVDKLIASDRAAYDQFGGTVAIDGNYAFVGASYEDDDTLGNKTMPSAGSVYIYKRDVNGNWSKIQKIVASDRGVRNRFGISVSVSGDYAVIGALLGQGDSTSTNFQVRTGSAYVFELKSNGQWEEIQEIVAVDGQYNDQFASSVSISGKYIIVGAPGQDHDLSNGNFVENSGAAYIYEQNSNGIWQYKQKIIPSQRLISDHFGRAVSISGNYAVIGTDNLQYAPGSAYIIERNSKGLWIEKQHIFSLVGNGDIFGRSVSISGSLIIIGAAHSNTDTSGLSPLLHTGAAFIYERNPNGLWVKKQKIVPSDRSYTANFGISVSISGNKAIVGAYGVNLNSLGLDSLLEAGAAYTYRQNWNGQWKEEQKIVASDRAYRNHFGHAVAISNNYAVCGSINEQDLNGNNTLLQAGAAYVFEQPPCASTGFNLSVVECESYTVLSSKNTHTTVGNYIVMDTIPNNCGGDSVLTIDLTILPKRTSNVNTTICNNDSVIVNGTVYDAAHPSGTEVIPNIGPYNCDSTITVNLNVLEPKIDSVNYILCPGDTLVVNGTTYDATHLSGTEILTGIGPYNCDSTVIIDLKKYSSIYMLPLTIGEVCVNEQVEVLADIEGGKPPYNYLWVFDNNGSRSNPFSFIPTLITEDQLYLKVLDDCDEGDSIKIFIEVSDCELIIPNVITPNGDGVNEYFHIQGLQHYESNNLQVYNRWGVLLFNQANYRNTWDGYQCPEGVYFYILETTKNGITNTHKGSVTLLK